MVEPGLKPNYLIPKSYSFRPHCLPNNDPHISYDVHTLKSLTKNVWIKLIGSYNVPKFTISLACLLSLSISFFKNIQISINRNMCVCAVLRLFRTNLGSPYRGRDHYPSICVDVTFGKRRNTYISLSSLIHLTDVFELSLMSESVWHLGEIHWSREHCCFR